MYDSAPRPGDDRRSHISHGRNSDACATVPSLGPDPPVPPPRRSPVVFQLPGERRGGAFCDIVDACPKATYDALALGLRSALDGIVPGSARVAKRLVALRAWVPFGFARVDDFARERLCRSGRWLRDLAALGEALESSPALTDALTGADGGRPIGQVAALAIGRVAKAESVGAWVDLARRVPVRQFKAEARRAREADSAWPVRSDGSKDCENRALCEPQEDDRRQVWLIVPHPVKLAFEDTHRLHRAVCGRETGVASFVEALIGEAYAGPHPPRPEIVRLPPTRGWAALEAMVFRSTRQWEDLDREVTAVVVTLGEAEEWIRQAGRGGPEELCLQLEALIALEDRLQKELARLLALIGHERGWSKLQFAGMGHYAEQRLGISRTTVRDRVGLVRALERMPVVRRAYEAGTIGLEATLLIVRLLARTGPSDELQRTWVRRAEAATLKRMRDEVRVLKRTGSLQPLTDEQWHASLRLAPGETSRRVQELGEESVGLRAQTTSLRLTLDESLAHDFVAAIEGWRDALAGAADDDGTVAGRAARLFSTRGRPVPQWVGLLAMLEDFTRTWDDPAGMPKRAADRIYIRDGWRCSAPGCTSRQNMESHHLQYRSQGGELKAESNQTCACGFHHRMGEHGEFAECRGEAPLNIDWRLGREDLGRWYRNELRVSGPTSR